VSTAAAAAGLVTPPWRDLLPVGRRFVALPSARRPVILAEDEPGVRSYVRTALLATPPGSSLPDWACAGAGRLLRVSAAWRLLPAIRGADGGEHGDTLAALIATAGTKLLVLRHSHDPDPRIVLLLFDQDRPRQPRFAVKVATGPGSGERVLIERARIGEAAHALRDAPAVVGPPAVVDLLRHRGMPALVTAAQPGVPMLVTYHRRGHTARPEAVGGDLAAAADWLSGLQAATVGPAAPLALAPGIGDGLRGLSRGPREQELVADRLDELRERLLRHRAPTTLVHGDFWPGNLLVERGAVSGVVDWEHSQTGGNPLRDWARFVVGYSAYLDGHTRPGRSVTGHPGLVAGAPGAGVGYGVDGSGWYPSLVRAFLRRGLAQWGLPESCARDAVLAEVAALAAEATDPEFARAQLLLFLRLSEGRS
jgi:Phosphotransferase enzyme family